MPWPLAANLSILFTEAPLPERVALAAAAGFEGVEVQFPYDTPAEDVARALQQAGLPLVLINVPAGDLMTGGPGLAAEPARRTQFGDALDQAIAYARIVRPQRVNVLPGRLAAGVSRTQALDALVANCQLAATRFVEEGIAVTCEAINRHDMPGFLVATAEELAELLDSVAHPNLSAQLDLYHMARMGEGAGAVEKAISTLSGRIGHVQFADCPGRGAPGQGELDFEGAMLALEQAGYAGWLSAEYRPTTAQRFDWIPRWREAGWVR